MTTAHHHFTTIISSPKTISLLERAKSLLLTGSFDQKTRPILVFSGPSGAGKSTLLGRLFKDFPSTFGFSVSNTTRQPRKGEVDGIDYNFVNEDKFKVLIAENSFLEYANFSGNWYGTTWNAIQKIRGDGRICILDVDLAGVKSIKSHIKTCNDSESDLKAQYIFVRPVCKTNLEGRLRGRGSESEESLSRRLARVDDDFEYAEGVGNYDLILVNDDFDSAYAKLVSFIFDLPSEQ